MTDSARNDHHAQPRVALIGISGWAVTHFQLLTRRHREGLLHLTACVAIDADQHPDRIAILRELGTAVFASVDELFSTHRGRLDLCVIPTGIAWHARMTIAALEAGAHVLVEKPLAGSVAEGQAMIEASARTGRFVAVAYQDYHQPATIALEQAIADRRIGEVTTIGLLGLWPRGVSYYTRNAWAGRLVVDGRPVFDSPLNNAFAHFLNLVLHFASSATGPVSVESASISARLWRVHDIGSFDTALVEARTATGIGLRIAVSHACHETVDPVIEITGTAGRATWRANAGCEISPHSGPAETIPLLPARAAQELLLADVLRRLDDPAARICDAARALAQTQFIAALHRDHPIVTVPPAEVVVREAVGHTGQPEPVPAAPALVERLRSILPALK